MTTVIMLLLSHVLCAPLHAGPGITVLMSDDSEPYQALLDGFQEYLRANGIQADYVVKLVGAGKSNTGLLAGQTDEQGAALIYCIGTPACLTAQKSADQRPIVASLVLSPDSLSPDVQATGVFLNYLPETQLQWLNKLFPQFQRIGVIYNPEQNQALIDRAVASAHRLGMELVAIAINSPKELPGALKGLLRDIDILWALPDTMVLAPQSAKEVLLTSFRNRIPVIGASAPWVKGGALYALDWDYMDLGAQNAVLAMKVLEGTPITKLPMAEPRSVAYTLNLKTAKHMKLDIPAELPRGAKHVYQ